MTDQDTMPFGEHKGKNMEDVPARYLLWLYDDMRNAGGPRTFSKEVFEYIEENHHRLMKEEDDYIPKFKPSR